MRLSSDLSYVQLKQSLIHKHAKLASFGRLMCLFQKGKHKVAFACIVYRAVTDVFDEVEKGCGGYVRKYRTVGATCLFYTSGQCGFSRAFFLAGFSIAME